MAYSDNEVLKSVACDYEGYLLDWQDWTMEIAVEIARELDQEMDDTCWKIIGFARQSFAESGKPPTRRKMVSDFNVDAQDLFDLFPSSPMRKICKIAGLPKPKNCL